MLIDAHAHLDRYEDRLDCALEEITQHQIFTISNSMDLPSYSKNLEISKMCQYILPTFGIHPWNALQYVDQLESLNDFIEKSPMLGEIGLDYYFVKDTSQFPAQKKVFEFFLCAAKEQNKLVNLHTKGAEKDVLDLLEHFEIERVIVHWYSGPFDILQELLDRGAYFTIGVEMLHSAEIKAIAQKLPLEQLLTETDNPGGWEWLTDKIGMPSLIKEVIQALAELKKTKMENIMEIVQANFLRLIRDDSWLSEVYAYF